jgi:hypothetical protein
MNDNELGFDLNEDFTPMDENSQEESNEKEEVVENSEETKEEPEATEEKEEKEEKSEDVEASDESKEDEPAEETKDETEDVVSEETKEEPEAEATEEVQESSLNISELTGGRFETAEELTKSLEYADSVKPMDGVSVMEQLDKQIEERFGEGYTLSDVLTYKSKDFREMDSFDVLKEHLYLKDPEITDAEIRAEFRPFNLLNKSEGEIAQMIEDEVITQDEIDDLEAALSRKVRVAREDLEEFQSELNIDDLQIYSKTEPVEQPNQKSQEELEADAKRYESVIDNLEKTTLDVGTKEDPHQLTFEPDDKDREGVREFLANGKEGESWIQKHWMEKDGTINMNKLSEDILKINNYERDIKIAFNQGLTKGGSKEVKDISNIDFKGGDKEVAPSDGLSEAARVVNEIN